MSDEYDGQGGSFILDPATGRRTRVEVTAEPVTDNSEPPPVAGAPQTGNVKPKTVYKGAA